MEGTDLTFHSMEFGENSSPKCLMSLPGDHESLNPDHIKYASDIDTEVDIIKKVDHDKLKADIKMHSIAQYHNEIKVAFRYMIEDDSAVISFSI